MESDTEQIISFLHKYGNQAWTITEIADQTGTDPNVVIRCLSRLEEQELVHRTDSLWTITEDDDYLTPEENIGLDHNQYRDKLAQAYRKNAEHATETNKQWSNTSNEANDHLNSLTDEE